MSIVFQIALAALVLFSFLMVVGVPVAYASPQNWTQSKPLLYLGSGIWAILVILVAVLNFFVDLDIVCGDWRWKYTWHGHGLRLLPPKSPNSGGL